MLQRKFVIYEETIIQKLKNNLQSIPEVSIYRELKNKIDAEEIAASLKDNYYNLEIFRILSELFNISLYVENQNTIGGIRDVDRIAKSILTNLKKTGESSAFGSIFLASFGNIKDLFIVKVPAIGLLERVHQQDDIMHEFFVASQCLNPLRKYIPNFAYVLANFKCYLPFYVNGEIANINGVQRWCANGDDRKSPANYTIMEKIDGPPAREYIKEISNDLLPNRLLSMFYQVVLAIGMAEERCGFTHYDLHWENVLIRNAPDNTAKYITYTLNNQKYHVYLSGRKVSTIIDYGYSHVQYKDEKGKIVHAQAHYSKSLGIFQSSRIWHDIFKFFHFTLMQLYVFRSHLVDSFSKIGDFMYGSETSLEHIINVQLTHEIKRNIEKGNKDTRPPPFKNFKDPQLKFYLTEVRHPWEKKTVQEFIEWSIKNVPGVNNVVEKIKSRVFTSITCDDLFCRTKAQLYNKFANRPLNSLKEYLGEEEPMSMARITKTTKAPDLPIHVAKMPIQELSGNTVIINDASSQFSSATNSSRIILNSITNLIGAQLRLSKKYPNDRNINNVGKEMENLRNLADEMTKNLNNLEGRFGI